ncbi:hypothetical protein [Mesorhizobium caraganae]|uniref:hypothetical protein n=1 Tax=Mesorhizobium caraganae TaxID=483206 RepID=UPI003ECF6C86
MTDSTPTSEDFAWSEKDAEALAESVFGNDPFHEGPNKIYPSLLSAEDIVAYVKQTAMISPFYANNKKLKHASYEACIGEKAFKYGKNGIEQISLTPDGFLRVPANAIVFVESEVMFRLPRYIAARFNLQIKHVHRGLLLGTGPLVDPGFRGKLLIPLHNLTSADYYLHKDDGFIWIEFTRTTYDESRENQYGDYPDRKKISDGAKWLHKASFDEHLKREVPIRSSILPIVERVDARSRKAVKTVRELQRYSTIGALGLVITFGIIMLTEIYANRSFMQSAYNLQLSQGGEPVKAASGFGRDLLQMKEKVEDLQATFEETKSNLEARIGTLETENAALRRAIGEHPSVDQVR